MRDVMYWLLDVMGATIASSIVYTRGIKVETRVKIRERHLSWVPPHAKFGYRRRAFRFMVGSKAEVDWTSARRG
ncbi:uncharacterized protein N7446_012118 [Penicillium canescens]|uniref:uncharacterized protein n=1 Tax=Penicillium canescens TaxID=5083 RepID=UPI0026DF177C|nr:uncharacterized protein N7446_012118 [Penicillium canescens]KAJ6047284.1 hypothetical protein N7446_012118 [Penicillium canescens]